MSKFNPENNLRNSKVGFFFLVLYLAAVFIRPHEWTQSNFDFPFIRVLLIISFIFYMLVQRPKSFSIQGWYLVGVGVVILLSSMRNGWLTGGIISTSDFFALSIIPFILFSSLLYDKGKVTFVLCVMLFATLFMLHHGYSQVSSPIGVGWSGESLSQGTRITYLGFFNDPNDLGMFFVMNIPFAFYLYSVNKNFIVKLFFILLVCLLTWGIYKTNSRGTLLGGVSLFAMYLFFRFSKVKAFSIILICIPIVLLVMGQFREIDSNEESAGQRIEAWYTAVMLFKTHPFFGVMKGSFMDYHHLTTHNSYALVMAELGSLGYAFWFSFLVFTWLKLFTIVSGKIDIMDAKKELWAEEGGAYKALCKALLFSLTGFMVTAFFLSRSYIVTLYIFIGICTAMIMLTEREFMQKSDVSLLNKKLIKQSAFMSVISLIGLYFIIKILI